MTSIAIDLGSDTATRPGRAMLAAMTAAPVGDEQRGEDPTVSALNERVADLLGMEDALFLPSGTMCNQIAFLVHCRPGDEIIAAANSHVVCSEGAGAAALAGAQFLPLTTASGIFGPDDLRAAIRAPRPRGPKSRVVSVEQTTNRGGGQVWPVTILAAIAALAGQHGLAAHIDGARLMNAVVASGTPAREQARGFDSAWIDLSKGLGCPFGAVLAGSKGFIADAWIWKHRLGGAMRQAGLMAAAGLFALDHNVARLAEDHANARLFADEIAELPGITVFPAEITTNILFLDVSGTGLAADDIAAGLRRQGIRIGVESPTRMRIVTHLDVSASTVRKAATALAELVRNHRKA